MTALPGLTPRSPRMTLGPVFVTVDPPRTAKLCAVPSGGAVCAEAGTAMQTNKVVSAVAMRRPMLLRIIKEAPIVFQEQCRGPLATPLSRFEQSL